MATNSCSHKNEGRQEINPQNPFLGRRELCNKPWAVAEPGLASAYKPSENKASGSHCAVLAGKHVFWNMSRIC